MNKITQKLLTEEMIPIARMNKKKIDKLQFRRARNTFKRSKNIGRRYPTGSYEALASSFILFGL